MLGKRSAWFSLVKVDMEMTRPDGGLDQYRAELKDGLVTFDLALF
jgi:hypothetical protein